MKDCEPSFMKNWLWKDKMYGMLFDERFLYHGWMGEKHTSKSGRQSTFQKFTVPFLPLSNYLNRANLKLVASLCQASLPFIGPRECSGAFPHFFRVSGNGREPNWHYCFLHPLGSPLHLPALATRSWIQPHKEPLGLKRQLRAPLAGQLSTAGEAADRLPSSEGKRNWEIQNTESVSGERNPWVGDCLCPMLKMFR